MSEKRVKANFGHAVDQCARSIYMRTLYMLPKPPLPWRSMVEEAMTEEEIAASRIVAKFHSPPTRGSLTLMATYGIGWVDATVRQPEDEKRIFLPSDNERCRIKLDLMKEEPPAWAETFCIWVKQTTDVYTDCMNFARTADAMCQLLSLGDIRLLWPDLHLMTEAQLEDGYTTAVQREFLNNWTSAPSPKKPMTRLWPGMREDIEKARATVGRALLAEPKEPKESDVLLAPGYYMPAVYRRASDELLKEVITVNERAGVRPSRYFGLT